MTLLFSVSIVNFEQVKVEVGLVQKKSLSAVVCKHQKQLSLKLKIQKVPPSKLLCIEYCFK